MSPPPRRLSFAVGTTLLSASLATGVAGCDKKTSNPGPEPPHVNEGPEEAPPDVNVAPEPDEPDAAEDGADEAGEEPAAPDEPNVNTVPDEDT